MDKIKKLESKLGQVASKSVYRAIDTTQAGSTSFSGVIVNLTAIAQGSDSDSRQGDRVRLQRLECKLKSLVADTTNVLTFLFFTTTLQAPNVVASNIFNNQGSVDAPIGPLVYDNLKNIRVIKRIEHYLDTYHPQLASEFVVSLGNSLCQYTGISGTDIQNGGLFLGIISDSGAVSHPSWNFSARVFFTTD